MRIVLASIIGACLAFYSAGCSDRGGVDVAVETPSIEVDAPVIEGAGVYQIDVEPAPADRVYVYDEGFPPGVYLYGGFYYYNGYRYDHDVFVSRYVKANISAHRFVDVQENRSQGRQLEEKQKVEFQKTGGKRPAKAGKPAAREQAAPPKNQAQRQQPPAERTEKPAVPAEKPAERAEKPADHDARTPEKHDKVTDPKAKPAQKPAKEEPKEEKKDEK